MRGLQKRPGPTDLGGRQLERSVSMDRRYRHESTRSTAGNGERTPGVAISVAVAARIGEQGQHAECLAAVGGRGDSVRPARRHPAVLAGHRHAAVALPGPGAPAGPVGASARRRPPEAGRRHGEVAVGRDSAQGGTGLRKPPRPPPPRSLRDPHAAPASAPAAPPILPDDVPPPVHPEDFLPYFQYPEPPGAREPSAPPSANALPPSSASYHQSP